MNNTNKNEDNKGEEWGVLIKKKKKIINHLTDPEKQDENNFLDSIKLPLWAEDDNMIDILLKLTKILEKINKNFKTLPADESAKSEYNGQDLKLIKDFCATYTVIAKKEDDDRK